jgi:hypothetical protein
MDDIQPIHRTEDRIEPTPHFAGRVMAAVRREAMLPLPIPFPWRRVAIGAALGLGASTAFASSPAVTSGVQDALAEIARASGAIDPLYFGTLTGVLVLTLGTLQFSVWFARRGT